MKILLIPVLLAFVGCTSSTTTTPSGGSMSPIQAAGCDVETVLLGGASSAVATALSCSNTTAIQTSFTTALGNANFCATPIPPTTASGSAAKAKTAEPVWTTIGQIPVSALHAGTSVEAKAVKTMGVVGSIACPIAINTVIGFLTNSVPAAWGCSATASAAQLETVLTAACEAAVPI